VGHEVILSDEKWKESGGKRFRSNDQLFTSALAEEVCARYALGESLSAIARCEGMPNRNTVHHWALVNKGGFFREMFEMAATLHFIGWGDDIIEIADDMSQDHGDDANAAVYRAKLRIDTRKWLLARMLPKQFGDKPQALGPQRRQLIIELVKAHVAPHAEKDGSGAANSAA